MKTTNDATVRRNDLAAAARRVLTKARKLHPGSLILARSDAGHMTVASDYGAATVIAMEDEWSASVRVSAAAARNLLKAKLPPRLALTYFDGMMMIGGVSLRAAPALPLDAWPDPKRDGPRLLRQGVLLSCGMRRAWRLRASAGDHARVHAQGSTVYPTHGPASSLSTNTAFRRLPNGSCDARMNLAESARRHDAICRRSGRGARLFRRGRSDLF